MIVGCAALMDYSRWSKVFNSQNAELMESSFFETGISQNQEKVEVLDRKDVLMSFSHVA